MAEMLQVTVCYAAAGFAYLEPMQVREGTTIGEAVELSGVLQAHPEINLSTQPVGIYAKKKTLDTVLRERDRVEIYRALVADPKESRRKRAAKRDTSPPQAA